MLEPAWRSAEGAATQRGRAVESGPGGTLGFQATIEQMVKGARPGRSTVTNTATVAGTWTHLDTTNNSATVANSRFGGQWWGIPVCVCDR